MKIMRIIIIITFHINEFISDSLSSFSEWLQFLQKNVNFFLYIFIKVYFLLVFFYLFVIYLYIKVIISVSLLFTNIFC
jgi:hypothetical protein